MQRFIYIYQINLANLLQMSNSTSNSEVESSSSEFETEEYTRKKKFQHKLKGFNREISNLKKGSEKIGCIESYSREALHTISKRLKSNIRGNNIKKIKADTFYSISENKEKLVELSKSLKLANSNRQTLISFIKDIYDIDKGKTLKSLVSI